MIDKRKKLRTGKFDEILAEDCGSLFALSIGERDGLLLPFIHLADWISGYLITY